MFLKFESWIQKWLKENAIEKLVSLMLVSMIVMGFSLRYLYKGIENGCKETIGYLQSEIKSCKDVVAEKDRINAELNREFRIALLQIKFNISERIDSISDEKTQIN